mmetsp:Transcript_59930/g.90344  ORF Transcript_59930/g.90344 Transcript_59930/m.90344 type:complete len:127 (+) Transcript_59930:112-492(+)
MLSDRSHDVPRNFSSALFCQSHHELGSTCFLCCSGSTGSILVLVVVLGRTVVPTTTTTIEIGLRRQGNLTRFSGKETIRDLQLGVAFCRGGGDYGELVVVVGKHSTGPGIPIRDDCDAGQEYKVGI